MKLKKNRSISSSCSDGSFHGSMVASTNSDADKSTTGSAAEESQNAGKDTLVMATNAAFRRMSM